MITQAPIENSELITIGVVVKPHGVRGELDIFPHTDNSRRFYQLTRVFLTSVDSGCCPYVVEKVRLLPRGILIKLKGVDNLDQAEKFRGCEIQIPRDECVKLPKGHYYIFEVIDLTVYDTRGERIGTVVDVYSLPANDVLVVQTASQKEILMPVVRQVVKKVDLSKGEIIVEPIAGLWEEEDL